VTGWWWLSFADGNRPVGQQFLGAALVQADDFITATTVAHVKGCNPGGEVLAFPVPPDDGPPPTGYRNRLLSRSELEAMQAIWTPEEPRIMTLDEYEAEEAS
jgi:hypothetical protein